MEIAFLQLEGNNKENSSNVRIFKSDYTFSMTFSDIRSSSSFMYLIETVTYKTDTMTASQSLFKKRYFFSLFLYENDVNGNISVFFIYSYCFEVKYVNRICTLV